MFDDNTSAAVGSAHRRLHDVAHFQIPRLAQCESSLADQQQLAAELREDMDTIGRMVEELAVAVGDQQGEKGRRELEKTVNEMRDTLSQLRRDTRAALLASKKAIDSRNARAVREELFSSPPAQEKQSLSEKATDDVLMKANDDVTEALRRTIALMQGELERSVLSTQMLEESTATLRATSQTHDTLTSLMSTSKQLITALEKADWLDRILILSAFMFFVLVVLFVLKKRFIDRSLRIALWWTRFIPLPDFGSQKGNLLKAAEESSVAFTATTAVTSRLVSSSLSAAIISSKNGPSLSEEPHSAASSATDNMQETTLTADEPVVHVDL